MFVYHTIQRTLYLQRLSTPSSYAFYFTPSLLPPRGSHWKGSAKLLAFFTSPKLLQLFLLFLFAYLLLLCLWWSGCKDTSFFLTSKFYFTFFEIFFEVSFGFRFVFQSLFSKSLRFPLLSPSLQSVKNVAVCFSGCKSNPLFLTSKLFLKFFEVLFPKTFSWGSALWLSPLFFYTK
jgi:hypothetical protein